MADRNPPTPAWTWPKTVKVIAPFYADNPEPGVVQVHEAELARLTRERDELVAALELSTERFSRRIANEGHTDACSECRTDMEIVTAARGLLARVRAGK